MPLTIGQRITYFRHLAGLSRAVLAERLDISRNTLANWEGDRSSP